MNRYYGYDEFLKDSKELLKKVHSYNPDSLLLVARGGLSLGHILSIGLNIREVYSINSVYYMEDKQLYKCEVFNIPDLSKSKKLLIIDDIIDSGETMATIQSLIQSKYPNCNHKIATLFYKKSAKISPDFYINEANEWIDFFWEKDINEK